MANVVLVVSGKGGTGKTLVSVNLGYRLKEKGFKVGVIDADITNPNLPQMMKIDSKIETTVDKLKPVNANGLEVVSMGLIAGDSPICMEGGQLAEFLRDIASYSEWNTDYLIVDLPATMSDEFKKMVTTLSDGLLGSIVVTQPAHILDAERVVRLHLDNGIPIVGLIENMSYFKHGKMKLNIFGKSAVDQLAEKYGVEILGKIPLCMAVRKAVEEKAGYLENEYAQPILNAVEKIVTLKPQKPGFLARIKAKAREMIEALLIQMVVMINKEINIGGLQNQYGYPGGKVIRFNLMDDNMERIIVQVDFKIQNGMLVAVENPRKVDVEIDITPKALAWAVLGDRQLADGSIYTLETAWYIGEARVWGTGETVRGVHFLKEVWEHLRENQNAMQKLKPLLERLA